MGKRSSKEGAESRADRKFEKKLEFYTKVRDTVASLTAQKSITKKKLRSRQKKLKAYDLSSLTEFLPELKSSEQKAPADVKVNSKTRQNLVLKEGNQLKIVINHPTFQSDPLGAIYQHLKSTQPPTEEKPKRKENKDGKKKKVKRKKSKSSGALQPMEA
ncbi:hypothetical protein M9H77_20451 [Catharanthus roseus]|uniref:Uncharacterized protein n=1 Tax=Catharanthus roseus TaxID=4058 RepID=A0ACC0AME4_CATRO|nr:hypothetical protein M9H77_20451 [Catharanthus roseus]